MTIKRILFIILLILVILLGGYITYFGINGYVKYSGRESDFNNLKGGDLHDDLLVKGHVTTMGKWLGKSDIDNDVFGIPVSDASAWHYYVYPFQNDEDKEKRKYCVFAVSRPKDIAAVEALVKNGSSAERFEFHAISMDMNYDVYHQLTEYLWDVYDTEFNIHAHANVSRYIEPYTIYVRTEDAGGIRPIIIGAAMILVGGAVLIIYSFVIYRKEHRF